MRQAGLRKLRVPQIGTLQGRGGEVGTHEPGTREISAGEVRLAQVGSGQVGASEVTAGQIRTHQTTAAEVGARQGQGVRLHPEQHGSRSLVSYLGHRVLVVSHGCATWTPR